MFPDGRPVHIFQYALGNNNVVRGTSPRQKGTLIRADEGTKEGSESMDKDLCDNFVASVTETNGSKVADRIRMIGFRD